MAEQTPSQMTHAEDHYGAEHLPDAPLFDASHVTVRYGQQTALDDLSFTLNVGERVAVVGPNGAGKSTLFKLIVGEIRPDNGSANLYGSNPAEHLCVAYVPQRQSVDWSFPVTVQDVVMMGRTARIGLFRWAKKQDRDFVYQSLERVNATHLIDKQIGELSGGQQQRVFIARALAQEAELLLLDEPLAGLDLPSQEQVFEVLESVTASGITAIVATHDLNMAARRFDQVLLLNGRLIALGKPADVLTADNLVLAYGGHLHTQDGVLIADTCCDH